MTDRTSMRYKLSEFDAALNVHAFVIDVETKLISSETGSNIYNNPPDFIVAARAFSNGSPCSPRLYYTEIDFNPNSITGKRDPLVVYVGHNICFDLNYVDSQLIDKPNFFIWDTALADYLLNSQRYKTPTLSETHSRWCPLSSLSKSDPVGDSIRDGVCPSRIPIYHLIRYLTNDIKLTDEVFRKQLDASRKLGVRQHRTLLTHMMYLKQNYLASVTGMNTSTAKADLTMCELEKSLDNVRKGLEEEARLFFDYDLPLTFEWDFNKRSHLKTLFYGEPLKHVYKVQDGVYKTGKRAGQPKYKNETVELKPYQPISIKEYDDDKIDEKRMVEIYDEIHSSLNVSLKKYKRLSFLEGLFMYRKLSKELSTYYGGYLNYTRHSSRTRGLETINPQYNHTLTPTRRISSSKPNLQNIKG